MSTTGALDLDSTSNTRDLAGYRTAEGCSVRPGLLFRSGSLAAPTPRDAEILRSLDLRHAVDFRSADEVAATGENQFAPGVRTCHVPLLDEGTQALATAIQAVLAGGDPTLVEELLGDGKAKTIAAQGPVTLVRSPEALEGFGATMRLLARAGAAPLIFSCTAGKDRTGIFAALLLRLLGVPEETVLADYELSNACRARINAATRDRLSAAGVEPGLLRPLLEQDRDNLAGMFRAIEEDFVSFDRFVSEGLGVNHPTVERLRSTFLTST